MCTFYGLKDGFISKYVKTAYGWDHYAGYSEDFNIRGRLQTGEFPFSSKPFDTLSNAFTLEDLLESFRISGTEVIWPQKSA